jgi:hypothetical protein
MTVHECACRPRIGKPINAKDRRQTGGALRMDAIEIALRLVGAFYVFAGYVATRAGLTSLLVDRAIAAMAARKPSAADVAQSYWMLAAAAIVLAGGAALMFLLDVAVWLFLLSAVGQAAYLFYAAPHYFDRETPPDATGRRQSTNAFIVYLIATALVAWAAAAGKLVPWHEADWPTLAAPAAMVVVHVGHLLWLLWGPSAIGGNSGFPEPAAEDDEERRDPSDSRRIKVMADYKAHPLWALDEDLYGDFPPEALGLSDELTRDLNAWAESYDTSIDLDDPAVSLWSDEQRAAHEAKARPLAVRLARERPDLSIYVLEPETGVVEVHPDEQAS